jgi:hypothetical protein
MNESAPPGAPGGNFGGSGAKVGLLDEATNAPKYDFYVRQHALYNGATIWCAYAIMNNLDMHHSDDLLNLHAERFYSGHRHR